jgi:diaminopimelate epimerase
LCFGLSFICPFVPSATQGWDFPLKGKIGIYIDIIELLLPLNYNALKIPFVKYHGAGNDFIMIDDREGKFGPLLTTEWIARACHRHFGVGADGMILVQEGEDEAGFFMKYYNSDGLTSSFCGNGGRCFAAFTEDLEIHGGAFEFLGTDGWHFSQRDQNNEISLSMTDVSTIDKLDEKTFVLNTGSPHLVLFTDQIENLEVKLKGREIRNSGPFKEKGINVNFVQFISPSEIKIRTYERGVEDETLACGTGVVASAIASAFSEDSNIHTWLVHAQGGDLHVDFKHEGGHAFTNVKLTGPAVESFRGEIEI